MVSIVSSATAVQRTVGPGVDCTLLCSHKKSVMRLPRLLGAIALLAFLAGPAPAAGEARHAALVVDANSGQVLHAQAADEPRYPASLTKMMTLYMAFELIDMGRLNYQSKIKISQEAASAAPSKLDLDPGEEIVLIDAIKALVTKSANDIAIAVAEHIGGSEQNFARLMTAKARQIGMTSTTFRNASGLPDPGQTTTARDMVTLALRLQDDFPRHYPVFATRSFTYNGASHRNHNTLLGSFAGTDGIKTGYTRASGFNLVTSVRRDGRQVVAAVFGGSSAASRNAHMRAILTRALPRASTVKTRRPMLIAFPRPAIRPAALAPSRPEPQPPSAIVAKPQPASRPLAVAAAADRPNAQPQPVANVEPVAQPVSVAATTEPPRPTIEIARVRRVMVAPRLKPAPRYAAEDTTEEPPAGFRRAAHPDRSTAPAAGEPVDATETVLWKSARPEPAAELPRRQHAMVTSPPAPPYVRSAEAPAPPDLPRPQLASTGAASASQPPVGPASIPGRAPSTLAAQAQALASTARHAAAQRVATATAAPHPDWRLQGPAAPKAGGGYHIQVGAFATATEAERQLATLKSRAGNVVGARTALALPVRKGDRNLFRARFAGFDANAAASACLELRRQGIDCFVMKGE